MIVPEIALPLYVLPPSRFVSERNALAKTLAANGDPAAAAVRKLPRPVGLAWVLNRLARDRPREVQALLDAGDALRAGQRRALAGKGAEELRAAEEELRARARALRGAAEAILAESGRRTAPGDLARIELLLRVAASTAGPVREELRRGALEREPEVAGGDLSGFAVVAGGGAPSAATSRPAPAGERRASGRGSPAREREERKARERAEEKARAQAERKARAERERTRGLAKREVDRATRLARLAEDAARRAEDHARAARARAEEARRNARQRQDALRALGPGRPAE